MSVTATISLLMRLMCSNEPKDFSGKWTGAAHSGRLYQRSTEALANGTRQELLSIKKIATTRKGNYLILLSPSANVVRLVEYKKQTRHPTWH